MNEERRQKLLELYEIGVQRFLYAKDDAKWFGIYRCYDEEYETENFKTRREAEDKAIAEYESLSETGER